MPREIFTPHCQLPLPLLEKGLFGRHLKELLPGERLPVREVVKAYIDLIGAQKISFVVYDAQETSNSSGALHWIDKKEADFLFAKNVEEVLGHLPRQEVNEFKLPMVAVGSQVKIGGEIFHFLQIDLVGKDEKPLDDRTFFNEVLQQKGRWLLVDTDNSFHSWGTLALARPPVWRLFMTKVLDSASEWKEIRLGVQIDRNFAETSIERGFSALRVHALKESKAEPFVVAEINL